MKIYIETLGCVKNMEDSERAAGILDHAGHRIVRLPEEADCIMVNTCGFIGDAKKESIDRIFEMAKYDKPLLVSGCLSQRYQSQLYREMPEVDLFLGVNDYGRLPEILEKFTDENDKEFKKRKKYFSEPEPFFSEKPYRQRMDVPYTASLKIAEGCDNCCTYCVIPSIRGPYRSRKREDILAEAESLVADGCRELVLIAQDVTGYGQDIYGELALSGLVRELCKIEDLKWLRLMYCYEDRITDELIKVMAEEEKVCNYIDIPIQHSEDRVLTAMNRRSTKSSIENTIGRLRKAMPDIHIRTTLITGFPGESQEEFLSLASFVSRMKFERLGVFAYSKEEGTPAAKMAGQVRKETKEKRRDALMTMQIDISLTSNQEKIGEIMEILVEEEEEEERAGDGASDGQNMRTESELLRKNQPHVYLGRSRFDAPEIDNSVIFTSTQKLEPGEIIPVKITDAFDYDLFGKAVL